MSQTSIQDQGFTPPDFIQKLLKRSSTASSENKFMSLSAISSIPESYFSSTPLLPQDSKEPPSKLHRAYSLNEEERISTKKFKIFFTTIMNDIYPETESLEIWSGFEKSLENPFEYDKFIDQLRAQKEQEKQLKQVSKFNLKDLEVTENFVRSNSGPQKDMKSLCRYFSERKLTICPQAEKEKMRTNIRYIKRIGEHGSNYMKQKL